VTPIRRLTPRLAWLIRFRRMLGLYAFFYGCLHLMTYVWLYAGFSVAAMIDDISRRRFITAGLVAWLLMVPLALTSTAWSIRKLGGKNWTRLHRLAYLSAVAGIVHYWWGVKQGDNTPMAITLVLVALLAARPILDWMRTRRENVNPVAM
jgi:methionine sulfoxide reductase heme-binding subunit